MARFCPLFSGSTGNSTYIGSQSSGILVDAGVSAKRIVYALKQKNIPISSIEGIFVTHEHFDHICGVKTLLKNNDIPLYASEKTLEELEKIIDFEPNQKLIAIDKIMQTENFSVIRFNTLHDCEGSSGYTFITEKGCKIAVCTDLGIVTPEVRENLLYSDLVMLESNHDISMLKSGPYPPLLKIRVMGEKGHLSNPACAVELPPLFKSGTKRFVLAHLSRENNKPELALEMARNSLMDIRAKFGEDYIVSAAPVENGEMIFL